MIPIQFDVGLYRGPQPDFNDLRMMAGDFQIRTVVNLEAPNNLQLDECLELGISQINLPLNSIFPPTKSSVATALFILTEPRFRPLYLHCRSGVDRTGFIVARYRINQQNWTRAQAIAEMIARGNHLWLRW